MHALDRVKPWLLVAAAGVLAAVLALAEERGQWHVAQVAYFGILFLLLLGGIDWWRKHRAKPVFSPDIETYVRALQSLMLVVAAGIIVVMLDAVRLDHWKEGIVAKAAAAAMLLAGGAFMIGVFLGFLFGFPSKAEAGTIRTGGQPLQSPFYNTNLQEIADWLTKVIVGASLVELAKIPPMVVRFGDFVAKSVNPSPTSASPANVVVNLVYFWSCGVLYGYLWTRYDIAASAHRPHHDTNALDLVDRWLNQPPGPKDDDDREAMMNAIKAASAGTRMKIFLDAEKYRRSGTEDVNERALPVFQALVEADAQEIFHRNRGQNALALMGRKKDPKDPAAAKADWSGALDLLNDAIRIRDGSREPNWHQYELARAVCRIHLDEQFNQKQKSAPDVLKAIRADLDKTGDILDEERKLIDPDVATTKEGVIATWQKLNPESGG